MPVAMVIFEKDTECRVAKKTGLRFQALQLQ